MATTASRLHYRYNLIEDYALAEQPPVAADVRQAFLTLQAPAAEGQLPATELLTVSNQNSLMRFSRDPASSSGWTAEQRQVDGAPAGQPITKLIGFYQGQTLFALAHYPASGGADQLLGMQRTPERGWAAMPMTPDLVNALGAMRQTDMFVDDEGTVYVYGVSENLDPEAFVILAADAESQQWQLVWEEEAAAGATYRLLPGQGGDAITVMTIQGSSATFRGGSVVDGMFVYGSAPAVTHDLGEGDFAARQVFPLPAASGDAGFLLLAGNGALFHVAGAFDSQPTVTPMTGGSGQPGGAQQVSVGLDSERRFMVFVIDLAANRLWLLRQSPSSVGAAAIAFEDWVSLGNALATIACPAVMTAGPEVFLYDLEARVAHLAQELESASGGSTWFTTLLATPTAPTSAATHTTTYTQEMVATDVDGNPVPQAVMTLHADRKTVAVANGISYHMGPNEPATVTADRHGIVTVATGAASLSAPRLRATASGFSKAQDQTSYRADLRVHQRLAGQDGSFPVTGASLQAAGLLPPQLSTEDAAAVATQIKTLGAAAVHMQGGDNGAAPGAAPLADAAFELDFSETGRIRGRALGRGAPAGGRQAPEALAGAFSLGHVVGDVIHFFKHQADEVKSIAVDVERGVVSLTINDARFVLRSVSEVADAIELVLKKVETLFKEVVDLIVRMIEWLRLLLELGSILRTKEVLKHYLEEGLAHLVADLEGDLPRYLDTQLAALETLIEEKLGDLGSIFGGDSFNSLVRRSSLGPLQGGKPLEAKALRKAYDDDAVRCNFVRSLAERHLGSLPSPAPAGPGAEAAASSTPTFQDLLDTFGKAFPTDQLQAKLQKMESLAKGFEKPSSFLDTTIVELLEALEELFTFVLGGIRAVLDLLLQLAGVAVSSIQEMVEQPIPIPVLSWLYEKLTGSKLSILDLFCLILAAPVTFLYQAFNGSEPFSSQEVAAIESRPLPWPAIPSTSGAAASATTPAATPASLPPGVVAALAYTTGILWLVYGVEDVVLDVALANDTGAPPPLVGVGLVLTGGAIQLFGAPLELFSKSHLTAAEGATVAAWAFAWLPVLVAGVTVILSGGTSVTRFIEVVGPWVDLVIGVIVLAVGVVAVALMGDSTDFKITDRVAAILPNFPLIGKPLALIPDEVGLVAVGVVDFAGDLGTGAALMIGQATEGG